MSDIVTSAVVAHGFGGGHALEHLATFGTDWLYVAVPVAVFAVVAAVASRLSSRGGGLIMRFADGAGRVTGMPAWAAATLAVLLGALVIAVIGFFWDVAWHIDRGRDEFLFSPPHMCLLVGITMIGAAGGVGTYVATRGGADVGWRIRRWRVPYGAAPLLLAGSSAVVGFGIDELWHNAYGLDVTMWSPPHLTMISAAAFAGVAGWLTYAEAGPGACRRVITGFVAGVTLIALSAWQLEYDLGVPQWRMVSQTVLVAAAAAFTLTAARIAAGPFGALAAVGHFLAVRVALLWLTADAWNLSEPRFPLYLAAAVAVEAVFALTARSRRSTAASARGRRVSPQLRRDVLAGAAVGSVGLAGEWVVTHLWLYHPWQPALFPEIGLALVAAVAAAVLGGAFGRIVSHQPTGMGAGPVAIAAAVILLAFGVTLPRVVPDATAEIRTTPAGRGQVEVAVRVEPAEAVIAADRWEVMAWQGRGRVIERLQPAADGWYRTDGAVPVHDDWKTVVRVSKDDVIGGAPVYMPADPEIDAAAVPLERAKTVELVGETQLLQREAHGGPAWPGIVAYTFVGLAVAALLASLFAGAAALNRRRRVAGWSQALAGRRVVLTGAASGIGKATREALERNGARVVGLDVVADRPDTIAVDVRDREAVRAAIDAAAQRLGGLDAVVANAGVGVAADSTQLPDADARRVLDVNLVGAWSTIAAALPHLQDGGTIVGITSGLATATVPYAAAYTASKRGLSGYLDVLRVECDSRWNVCEVQPGYIVTPIHDQPAATGASLDGLVRRDPIDGAVAAVVAACEAGRRFGTSSALTRAELWAARHLPRVTERAVRSRLRHVEAQRGRPTFAPAQARSVPDTVVLPDDVPSR